MSNMRALVVACVVTWANMAVVAYAIWSVCGWWSLAVACLAGHASAQAFRWAGIVTRTPQLPACRCRHCGVTASDAEAAVYWDTVDCCDECGPLPSNAWALDDQPEIYTGGRTRGHGPCS